jgi:hypothetical protein
VNLQPSRLIAKEVTNSLQSLGQSFKITVSCEKLFAEYFKSKERFFGSLLATLSRVSGLGFPKGLAV